MADIKCEELKPEEQERVINHFKGHPKGFARFGENGYALPWSFRNDANDIRRMTVRPDDVWVVTYPRSGTTWTQEMVWLLNSDLDYEKAAEVSLAERYFFVEFNALTSGQKIADDVDPFFKKMLTEPAYKNAETAASPRYFKTHLSISLLPVNLLETTKVVYVARDPRDVVVSFYHHNKLLKSADYVGDFKTYWNLFKEDLVMFTPFFPHSKEAWALRYHRNMLFLFYEDVKKDLPGSLRKIAKFLGKEYTNDQIDKLCDHLDIKNFKNNESTNPSWMNSESPFTNGVGESFVRKGKSGGWRDYFDDKMQEEASQWIQRNLKDTDLKFPTVNNL